jgi:5-methylcytosine-specific restriction endonuclease McrA
VRTVLLLNQSEEILGLITWQRAATLYVQGKAQRPALHEDEYEIRTVAGVFRLPTALVLVQYVQVPYRRLAVSRQNVLNRDGYECQYCGKALTSTSGTVDHVVPVSRGGGHVWKNVVAACAKCNNRKADRTLAEAGLRLRREPAVPTRTMLVITRIEVEKRETWKRWVAG